MSDVMSLIILAVKYLFRSVYLVLLLRFIISWYKTYKRNNLSFVNNNWFFVLVEKLSDPFLVPFQGIFALPIDLSPIIVFFLLSYFVEPLVFKVLLGF